MTAASVTISVLLVLGVGVLLLCCLGVLVMPTVYDRLHFLGPATTVGPVLLAVAVLLHGPDTQTIIKVLLIVVLLLLTSPVLTHATAHAAWVRQHDPNPQPADEVGEC